MWFHPFNRVLLSKLAFPFPFPFPGQYHTTCEALNYSLTMKATTQTFLDINISLNIFNLVLILSLPWLQQGKWVSKIEKNVHSYANWPPNTLGNTRDVTMIFIHSLLLNRMQIRSLWSLWRSLKDAFLVTLHFIGAKLILWLVRYPRSNLRGYQVHKNVPIIHHTLCIIMHLWIFLMHFFSCHTI